MSRKALFANLTVPAEKVSDGSSSNASSATPSSRIRVRPILGSPDLIDDSQARPVGALGQSLGEFSERAKRAEDIERRLTEGQVIIDLDPERIDPSFIADRMPIAPEALTSLMEKIRDHGQLNPILVRPHPDSTERYQVAFGHRRLNVAKMLGRQVRAVVRVLSDEELVIAQGQENHEREDLSYVEKALFARKLEQRGFSRSTIMAAMSIYKSDLSNMLSVASKVPDDIVSRIGPAPAIGRRGWIELSNLITNPTNLAAVRKAARGNELETLDSEARFRRLLGVARPKPDVRDVQNWSSSDGRALATVSQDGDRVSLTVDRRKAPEFAEFVLTRLRDLYSEFEAGSSGRS